MRLRQNFPAGNRGCTACSHCTASSVVQYPSPFWLPSGRGHGALSELELRAPSTSGDSQQRCHSQSKAEPRTLSMAMFAVPSACGTPLQSMEAVQRLWGTQLLAGWAADRLDVL